MSKFQNFSYSDTEEKSITIRKPHNALLLLDSRDRYPLDSDDAYVQDPEINPNDILINHQKLIGLGQIKRIAVTEISFPWSTPNINERNNTLRFTDSSTNIQYYITVPEDFYTPTELADEIKDILNTQGWINSNTGLAENWNAPWDVSVDPKTFKFTFESSSTGTNWKVDSSSLSSLMNITAYITSDDDKSITGGIPSMSYTSYIDVCSKTLTKYQNVKDSLTQLNYNDIICRIYLDNPLNTPLTDSSFFGSRPCINLYRQFESPKYILWNSNEMINSIDIQLRDENGDLLYIPNENWDLDYYITFQMSES